jgi:hypothetical protein
LPEEVKEAYDRRAGAALSPRFTAFRLITTIRT